jgi:hypothetical protein
MPVDPIVVELMPPCDIVPLNMTSPSVGCCAATCSFVYIISDGPSVTTIVYLPTPLIAAPLPTVQSLAAAVVLVGAAALLALLPHAARPRPAAMTATIDPVRRKRIAVIVHLCSSSVTSTFVVPARRG